jgi:DNA-binding NtrC family response regulator
MSSSIKILIVDDERDFLDAIEERLGTRGFAITTADSAEQALAAAADAKFDLALVDLQMPGMDGKALLQALKQSHRFLEVIMLTGHGSINSAVECTKLGAFSYLSKPYELEGLLDVLREAYEARLNKKFAADGQRLAQIRRVSDKYSPESLLKETREQMQQSPSFVLTFFREMVRLDDDDEK